MGLTASIAWVRSDVSPVLDGPSSVEVTPLERDGLPAGWRAWVIDAVPDGVPGGPWLWPALAAATGAPVLGVSLLDSDAAHVVFCDASGASFTTAIHPDVWVTFLHPTGYWPYEVVADEMTREEYEAEAAEAMADSAAQYDAALAGYLALLTTGDDAAQRAHAWALAAGLGPVPAAEIARLLGCAPGDGTFFVENAVTDLAAGLGLALAR